MQARRRDEKEKVAFGRDVESMTYLGYPSER